jgi:hypothetical protein
MASIPDGAKPALITVVYDSDNPQQPWMVEDGRQALRNETRHATKRGVMERVADILNSMAPPDTQ